MPRPKTKPPGPGTTPTQVRLTEADRAKAKAICESFGLPSVAAAIRFGLETAYRNIPAKSRKTPTADA